MTYPNPTPPSTVVVETGNVIHHVAHHAGNALAFTGFTWWPLVVAAVASIVMGLVFYVVAKRA